MIYNFLCFRILYHYYTLMYVILSHVFVNKCIYELKKTISRNRNMKI